MVETSKVEGKVSLAWGISFQTMAQLQKGQVQWMELMLFLQHFFRLEQLEREMLKENVGTAGINYINWAHNNGLKVWAMISNESMLDTTSEIMNDYKLRNKLINNIVNLVVKYNLDGINIDFETCIWKIKQCLIGF